MTKPINENRMERKNSTTENLIPTLDVEAQTSTPSSNNPSRLFCPPSLENLTQNANTIFRWMKENKLLCATGAALVTSTAFNVKFLINQMEKNLQEEGVERVLCFLKDQILSSIIPIEDANKFSEEFRKMIDSMDLQTQRQLNKTLNAPCR